MSARWGVVGCAALLLLGACSRSGSSHDPLAARVATTDSLINALRAAGRYEEALAFARERAQLLQPSTLPAWRRADADRETATLERITSLPDSARRLLADADRASPIIADRARQGDGSALALAERQLAVRTKLLGRDHLETTRSLSTVARIASETGETARARRLDREALEIRLRLLGERHPETAESLDQLGRGAKSADARDEAASLYARAYALRSQLFGEDSPEATATLMNIANLHRLQNRRAEAMREFRRVLALRRRALGRVHDDVAGTLTAMALTHTMAGEWREAEPLLREAVAIRRQLGVGGREGLALSLGTQGMALRHLRRYAEAESALAESAALQDEVRAALPNRRGAASFGLSAYWQLAAAQLEQGKDSTAWRSLEYAYSRSLLDALVARGAVDPATMQRGLLERVQRALSQDAALIGWLDVKRGAGWEEFPFWCYAIRRTGPVRWHRVDAGAGVPEDWAGRPLHRLRNSLRAAADWPARVTDTSDVARRAALVYRLRVAPLEADLEGVRELLVVSPDFMRGVPLESLRDDRGRLLADRFAVTYVSSSLLFTWEQERPPPARRPHAWRALLVGDPMHPEEPRAALTASGDEVRRIAAHFATSTVLTGAEATESRMRSMAQSGALARFDLVHFATHAAIDPDWSEHSALILARGPSDTARSIASAIVAADGRLTAGEIAQDWRLEADLVSLAGCRTALGHETRTEGFLGLDDALFVAGARSLLVSLWDVDDVATALLMERFYSNLAGADPSSPHVPSSRARALQEARRWVRLWRGPDGTNPFGHPAYWAGIVLVGDPG